MAEPHGRAYHLQVLKSASFTASLTTATGASASAAARAAVTTAGAITCVGTQRDILGECPLWDERRACLWWVDIRAPALRAWHVQRSAHEALQSWPMPELIGSIALADDGRLLVALRSRLALFEPADASLETLVDIHFSDPEHRFNDGRCDAQGRFWVGSMHNITRAPEGRLYRYDIRSGLAEVAGGICIPNSLAFSPDGRTMYFADSLAHSIEAIEFDGPTGRIGTRRFFAATNPPAFPDGSCVDAEGHLWNAEFHGARLVRHAPDGRIVQAVALPVRRPTCCAFGGPDLGTLYVTTTSQQMNEAALAAEPWAGALLAIDAKAAWGVQGLPEARFRTR